MPRITPPEYETAAAVIPVRVFSAVRLLCKPIQVDPSQGSPQTNVHRTRKKRCPCCDGGRNGYNTEPKRESDRMAKPIGHRGPRASRQSRSERQDPRRRMLMPRGPYNTPSHRRRDARTKESCPPHLLARLSTRTFSGPPRFCFFQFFLVCSKMCFCSYIF